MLLFGCFSCVRLCDPMAPLSMGFSRQEHWRWLPFPSPGDLPSPGIEPMSPALQADSLPLSYQGSIQNIHNIKFTILTTFKCTIQ